MIVNPNARNGIFLAPPQKLTLLEENDHIQEINYEWLLWLVRNDSELRFYSLGLWKNTRLTIAQRDRFECQRCRYHRRFKLVQIGAKRQEDRAYIHHIAELKLFPWLALHYDNLITLCHQCHEDVHERTKRYEKHVEPFTNFDASEQW